MKVCPRVLELIPRPLTDGLTEQTPHSVENANALNVLVILVEDY